MFPSSSFTVLGREKGAATLVDYSSTLATAPFILMYILVFSPLYIFVYIYCMSIDASKAAFQLKLLPAGYIR